MKTHSKWQTIGTVVGNATTSEFTFILKSFQSRVGDLVAVRLDVPNAGREGTQEIFVWGRVISINRFNPFFPYEAAQELSDEGISLNATILSNSRDQLEASVLILGSTKTDDDFSRIDPLTYPVQPAAEVFYPPTEAVKELLAAGIKDHTAVHVGTLIARQDVDVSISADRIVSRHMAILAMTGGGKTVATRRILRELIGIGYPLVIVDPHGDYLGLWVNRALFPGTTIKLLYPHLAMTAENRGIVETLIFKMTEGLSEPQREVMSNAVNRTDPIPGEPVPRYIKRVSDELAKQLANKGQNKASLGPCRRKLAHILEHLQRMEETNGKMRKRLEGLEFEKMPDPKDRPDEIVSPNTVSILYLGGYDHLTQTTIVSILLEGLYEHRASLSRRIPPFLAVLEEAHTFIPSSREAYDDVPSLATIRKVITEGRKFGTGLMLISQRPSRLDETILSQCNSFLILRLVNPRDQGFVKQIMENLSEQDAKMLPGFGPGQGIVSGQAVRFPLLVSVKEDKDLRFEAIGDEQFIKQAKEWKPDAKSEARRRSVEKYSALDGLTRKSRDSGDDDKFEDEQGQKAGRHSLMSETERWNKLRKHFVEDGRTFGELEAVSGFDWDKSHRRVKVSKYANLGWSKLPAEKVSGKRRQRLLRFLELIKEKGI